jgi:hypothetical protein
MIEAQFVDTMNLCLKKDMLYERVAVQVAIPSDPPKRQVTADLFVKTFLKPSR